MRIKALSVVSPWGTRIAQGLKTREIRSWHPGTLPIERLLIVENDRRLTQAGDEDPEGGAVAVVRISDVHDWTPEEAEAACSVHEPGLRSRFVFWRPGSFMKWKFRMSCSRVFLSRDDPCTSREPAVQIFCPTTISRLASGP